MDSRKLIAWVLIIILTGSITSWIWITRRRARLEKQRRHGPRAD